MEIKSIIESKIKAAGITKKEAAERMGIIPNNINAMIESPSWPTLQKLSGALGISVSELVSDVQQFVNNEQPSSVELTIKCGKCGNIIKVKEIKVEQ